jgi:hypothetical protein
LSQRTVSAKTVLVYWTITSVVRGLVKALLFAVLESQEVVVLVDAAFAVDATKMTGKITSGCSIA